MIALRLSKPIKLRFDNRKSDSAEHLSTNGTDFVPVRNWAKFVLSPGLAVVLIGCLKQKGNLAESDSLCDWFPVPGRSTRWLQSDVR